MSRWIKRITGIMLVMVLIITMTPVNTQAAKKIKLNKTKLTMIKGDSEYLSLNVYGGKGWKSSKKSVATVDKYGCVKAKGKGSCKISVKYKNKSYTCKVKVEDPAISEKTLTLTIGDSAALKLTGTSQKVQWDSDDISVATVSSTGVVKAVGEGYADITATVGDHFYNCSVTVKYDSAGALSDLAIQNYDIGRGVVSIVTNNGSGTLSIDGKAVYYSANGSMLDSSSDDNYCLAPGDTCALYYYGPTNADYDRVAYSTYDVVYNVEPSMYKSRAKGITVSGTKGADNVTAKVVNNSGDTLEFIKVACVFFDASGKAIGYEYHYSEGTSAGATDFMVGVKFLSVK